MIVLTAIIETEIRF